MNKNEFLNELKSRLKYIPSEDREDALAYYEEYIADMNVDDAEDITAILGTPKQVAREICAESTMKRLDDDTKSGKAKAGSIATAVWITIISIFSLPVLLPIALTVMLLILVVIIVGIVLILAGIAVVASVFLVSGFALSLGTLGTGLFICGIGLLWTIGIISLIKVIIRAISKSFGHATVADSQ